MAERLLKEKKFTLIPSTGVALQVAALGEMVHAGVDRGISPHTIDELVVVAIDLRVAIHFRVNRSAIGVSTNDIGIHIDP